MTDKNSMPDRLADAIASYLITSFPDDSSTELLMRLIRYRIDPGTWEIVAAALDRSFDRSFDKAVATALDKTPKNT